MKYSWGKPVGAKVRPMAANCDEIVYGSRRLDQTAKEAPVCGLMKKLKRFRSAFTTEQVNFLEKEFKKYPYIGNARRKDVSNILNIPERAVKIWFQNRRMKEKKDTSIRELEGEDQRLVKNEANVIANNRDQSVNEPRSLPMLTDERSFEIDNKHIKEQGYNEKHTSTKDTTPLQYYKEKVEQDSYRNMDQYSSISVIKETNVVPKSEGTAEFSIEFLKKYKNECLPNEPVKDGQIKTQSPHTHNQLQQIHQNDYAKSSQFTMPQDLSSQKSSPHYTKPMTLQNQRNPDVKPPIYLKGLYQPYIPPSNMIWNPINMSPVSPVSPGPEIMENLSVPQSNLVRRNCNCDCHYKTYPSSMMYPASPPVQYVLTAVPYQTSGPSFNVN